MITFHVIVIKLFDNTMTCLTLVPISSVARFCEMDLKVFLLVLSFFPLTLQKCVWYGECNEKDGRAQNCVYDGPPKELSDEGLAVFRRKCPLFLDQVPERKFCCDLAQVKRMESKIDLASIFQRCPTCMTNLNQHICHLTCSPNQSDFINPVEILKNGSIGGDDYIMTIDLYLSKEYKETTFNSCKEVTSPSSGEKAINLACGVWGEADQCTSDRWFEFFGNFEDNSFAPFWMNFKSPPNDSFKELHLHAIPCNESYKNSRPCSCSDCEASCTIPFEHPEPPNPFMVGQMDGVFLVMLIVFLAVSMNTAGLLFLYHKKERKGSLQQQVSQNTKKDNCLQEIGNKFKNGLTKIFTKWGRGCAKRPTLVFAISSWVIVGLGRGVFNMKVTTDPTEIWASPICKTRIDKDYFDSRFTPFYRTNQVFIKTKGLEFFNWTNSKNFTYTFGPAFNPKFLYQVYQLQMQIERLGADEGKGLDKICFAPMKNEFFNDDSVKYCTIQSVWGYLANDVTLINNTNKLYDQLQKCLRNNFDPDCLAPYGGPIFSPLAVGGAPENASTDPFQSKHLLATGVTLTFMVNNAMNKLDLKPALEWEKKFIDFLKRWKREEKPEFMEIAFSAERSIQDEIERESQAEMTTVIISYFVMFIYITVSLGRIRNFSSLLLNSKFTLGVGGIIIVLASVISSLGVFGYLGVATTLLTIEVIPFLVLAVGVDNIFILVHTFHQLREESDEEAEELIGQALGKVGPSILLTSTSEAACFFIGTLSGMPAIKTFAEYSSLAIVLNFILQISCFVSLLAVDSRRQKNNFADIFCCIKVKKEEAKEKSSNLLFLIFKNYYGPFLMKAGVRTSVVLLFILWLCVSIACIPHIERGLDQELSMPEDSHVVDYFQFMKDLFSVGPPVYFVVKNGLNYTNPVEVNAVCGIVGCDSDSLVTYLTRASRLSNISYIAKSPSSWIDDYFDWLSDERCCKQFEGNKSFCPHQKPECESCNVKIQDWRPTENDFRKYLPYFLNDNPDSGCPKGGHAAYAGGVNFESNHLGELQVTDNYFMAYHTSLKTSQDFYMALESSQRIANHLSVVLSKKLNRSIEVFPYSIFYVYYEQYLTIVKDALLSLGLSLLAILGVTFLFTGFDLRSSALVCLVVASLLVNMTAMLYWWNITLNAISLVNLLVAVGIGVEFCSHIMHAFVSSSETDKTKKALKAISTVGSSVFSGITLTKFLGIVVLAFAQTLMLRTFYFRMYLGIVVMGAAHGLVLMPVLLSYLGSAGSAASRSERVD